MQTEIDTSERTTAKMTCAPISVDASGQQAAEFCRISDVERLFGLKRGICYQKIASGEIKSVCLRKPGAKTGVRLIHLQSVRDWLNAQLV